MLRFVLLVTVAVALGCGRNAAVQQAEEARRAAEERAATAEKAVRAADDRAAAAEKALVERHPAGQADPARRPGPAASPITIEKKGEGHVLMPLDAKAELDPDGSIKMLILQKAVITDGEFDLGLEKLRGLRMIKGIKIALPVDAEVVLRQISGLQLQSLEVLALSPNKVSAKSLEALSGLPKLRRLNLYRCELDEAAKQQLGRLTGLRRLDLWSCNIDDGALKALTGLQDLEVLDLGSTKVTDAGVRHLTALGRLRTLGLSLEAVTDASMDVVASLPDLRALYLTHSAVTDSGIRHLAGLTKLEVLELTGTKVTDTGLKSLIGLPKLRKLYVVSCDGVTDRGIGALKAAMKDLATVRNVSSSIGEYE